VSGNVSWRTHSLPVTGSTVLNSLTVFTVTTWSQSRGLRTIVVTVCFSLRYSTTTFGPVWGCTLSRISRRARVAAVRASVRGAPIREYVGGPPPQPGPEQLGPGAGTGPSTTGGGRTSGFSAFGGATFSTTGGN